MREVVVSEVQIIPVKPKNGLVAFASCVIDNRFYVGDIAIHTRPDGQDYRLVYPSKILPNGKRINCVYPINREAADEVSKAVLSVFRDLIEKVGNTKRRSESACGAKR